MLAKLKSKISNHNSKITILLFVVATSCATYYQANYNFNQEFENGNLEKALASLQSRSSESKGKRLRAFPTHDLTQKRRQAERNAIF